MVRCYNRKCEDWDSNYDYWKYHCSSHQFDGRINDCPDYAVGAVGVKFKGTPGKTYHYLVKKEHLKINHDIRKKNGLYPDMYRKFDDSLIGKTAVVSPFKKTETVKIVSVYPSGSLKAKSFVEKINLDAPKLKESKTKKSSEGRMSKATKSIKTAKAELIDNQIGTAMIKTVKTGILKAPGLPDELREFLASKENQGIVDGVIGLLVGVLTAQFTDNPKAIKVSQIVQKAGIISLSSQITWVSDLIDTLANMDLDEANEEE